jgi:hypothetical protein
LVCILKGTSVIAQFLADLVDYDGRAIQSLWAYRTYGIQGESLLAFVGGCDIPFEHMVDLEDVRGKKRIWSPSMLHFIAEHFDTDLEKAVLRQRLLATLVREEFEKLSARRIERKGDDLFDGDKKLSISIAAVTPVSTKIHFGINVKRADGLDVPTEGLEAYEISPRLLAEAVLARYADEMRCIWDARTRSRGVL